MAWMKQCCRKDEMGRESENTSFAIGRPPAVGAWSPGARCSRENKESVFSFLFFFCVHLSHSVKFDSSMYTPSYSHIHTWREIQRNRIRAYWQQSSLAGEMMSYVLFFYSFVVLYNLYQKSSQYIGCFSEATCIVSTYLKTVSCKIKHLMLTLFFCIDFIFFF